MVVVISEIRGDDDDDGAAICWQVRISVRHKEKGDQVVDLAAAAEALSTSHQKSSASERVEDGRILD